jgi:hypothetical protein
MPRSSRSSRAAFLLGVVLAAHVFGGCAGCSDSASGLPRLRITNGGGVAATQLTVLFPRDEIEFGDVAADATTGYRTVPNGVYRYAAYRLRVNGQTVTQPVIDWVGEEPLDGNSFTSTIRVNPDRPGVLVVELVAVATDD